MRHADAAGAAHVARQRVADERGLARFDAQRAQRVRKNARIGLRPTDLGRIDDRSEQRAQAQVVADGSEVAVEVGHDTEAIVARELGQERDVVPGIADRVLDEPPRDTIGERVTQIQGGAEPGDQPADRLGEGQRVGDGPHKRVVSAIDRELQFDQNRSYKGLIQTDASINPGNSGGPLLDSAGRLIGVTTAILSPSGSNAGIGLAIPVDIVNRVVPDLIRNGRVPTPGIGIVSASEADAARLGTEGVIVVRTAPGSPAERAGIRGVDFASGKLGDIITEADGKQVRRLSDLTDQFERIGVGKTIGLTLKRGSQTRDVNVDIVDVARTQ